MSRFLKPLVTVLLWLGIVGQLWSASSVMASGRPLLMDGKKTLYQRVITHPGATLHQAPGDENGDKVTPFSVLYVYDRQNQGERSWLKVASNSLGRDLAWVRSEVVSEWKQSLVLLFADRAGRAPLLFFKKSDDLISVASSSGISKALKSLADNFQQHVRNQTEAPENLPVLAMEPPDESGAVPYDRFYLMPIFSYQEPFEGVKFLEVGSVDPGSQDDPDFPSSSSGSPDAAPTNAIAFVIDTTISMGPYIDKSLEVTRRIYDEVISKGEGQNVALGVVAFRNSTEARPKVEYTTKVISPLRTAMERQDFEKALSQVKEARASTHNYNEDSMAGIKTAVDELDWAPYVGRMIILITDAGPLEITDPYLSTMMSNREIADKAKEKNIRVITLHIKTPGGRNNHKYAEENYRALSSSVGGGLAYLPLDASTPEEGTANFALAAELLTSTLSEALFGSGADLDVSSAPDDDDLGSKAVALGNILGYSIKLDYLGRKNTSSAPQVVRSWIADKDLGRLDGGSDGKSREVSTVQVAVLLTKDQLSALSRQIKLIIEKAEQDISIGGQDFFQNILSASSQMLQDPSVFADKPDANLVELGVLGEFLEGLPYKSEIMTMTERDWYSMSIGQQNEFVYRLKSRLARYEEYDKDVSNWGKFDKDYPGDWLYRVPLNMLP